MDEMTTKTTPRPRAPDRRPLPQAAREDATAEFVREKEGIFHLVGSLADDASRLLRKETQLAKAEITQSLKKAGRGVVTMVLGAATLTAGFVVFLFALAVGVVALIQLTGLGPIPSILVGFAVMGLLMAGIGFFLVKKARAKLTMQELKPERTARTVKNTKNWVKEKI